MRYPLTRPFMGEEEVEAVRKVIYSGWIAQGQVCEKFEKDIEKYLHIKHAITVCNATAGLHLAILACGIGQGDEVLVSDYTYPATGFAPMYCGAKPVFVDVLRTTYNIDPSQIPKSITNKTKAIIPVHTFGQPADMSRIMKIANNNDLWVIEDAACALGAKYKDRYVGTIGDVGVFSLHARKNISTGEGGIVVTDDDGLAKKIKAMSNFGIKRAWERANKDKILCNSQEFHILGYNYKMSDISAAIGLVQLKNLDLIIDLRRSLAYQWNISLSDVKGIQIPVISTGCESVYQSYVVLLNRGICRSKLVEILGKRGMQTNIGTYACHKQKVFNCEYSLLRSRDVFKRALALPLYPQLLEEDIHDMVEIIRNGLGEVICS
jgi:perosamine synthetase